MAKDPKEKDSIERGLIRDLAQLLNENGLTEIEIERDGLKLRIARQATVAAAAAVTHAAAAAALLIAAREALDVSTLRAAVICGVVIGLLTIVVVYLLNELALRLQAILDVVIAAASQT